MIAGLKAEIDAGPLDNKTSIFSLIEQGLCQNPHGPAVICLHEPVDHLREVLTTTADEHESDSPDATGQLTLSYTQLHRTALRLAAGLRANGIRPGSTLLMLVPNGGAFALLLWTSILARLTFVCLDPRELNDEVKLPRLKSIVDDTRPDVVVVPGVSEVKVIDAMINTASSQIPLRISLADSGNDDCKSLASLAQGGDFEPVDEQTLVEEARHDDSDRRYSIMFTSGTSEMPKGCPLRVGGAAHMIRSWSWLINQRNSSHALQQAHNSRGIAPAQTVQTWSEGGAVVMTGNGFHVADMLNAISRNQASFIVVTPAMVHSLASRLAMESVDLTAVKTVQVGGDAVTRNVLTKCMSLFPHAQVCIVHGMTEGGACFRWPFLDSGPGDVPFFGQVCPVGQPARGATVRIRDANGKTIAARGQAGELHLSSDSIIRGYLNDASPASFYEEKGKKWFNTGDVAMMAEDGTVYILGRSNDVMRSDGSVLMPFVLESCLEDLTGTQASVVAVPHPTRGHVPFAVLGTLTGKESTAKIQHDITQILGDDYQLGGIVSLETLGLAAFPVNDTRKVIKAQVKAAVLDYLDRAGSK